MSRATRRRQSRWPNQLVFNEHGLIAVSRTTDQHSYLVPKPGVRLDLADLIDAPWPTDPALPWDTSVMTDVNLRGDMVGLSFSGGVFLLQRIRDGRHLEHPALSLRRRMSASTRSRLAAPAAEAAASPRSGQARLPTRAG